MADPPTPGFGDGLLWFCPVQILPESHQGGKLQFLGGVLKAYGKCQKKFLPLQSVMIVVTNPLAFHVFCLLNFRSSSNLF